MKHPAAPALLFLAVALSPLGAPSTALAQDPSTEDRLRALEEEVARLRGEAARTSIPGRAGRYYEKGAAGPGGGVYAKPFLARAGRDTYLGGYVDLEYFDTQEDAATKGADRTLRFHRLIPYIYSDVSENVKFATEIEIEDGDTKQGGYLSAEFAFIDWMWTDRINLRAGVILDPLGRFNLVHDSPINDLTERPLVSQTVLPSTFREAGFGFWGNLAGGDGEGVQVDYEAYLTTGFKGLLDSGIARIDTTKGLADARPHKNVGTVAFRDINNDMAFVGRLPVSPVLGVEFAPSAHIGKYDESGDNGLAVYAFDWTVDGKAISPALSALEFLGEYGYADIHRDDFAKASGIPSDLWGFYLQANLHLWPGFFAGLQRRGIVSDGAHLTLATRWDYVDLAHQERDRLTVGLNLRPNEHRTVFKFDYQWNGEGGRAVETDNDAFVASVATYF